ncbi:MAG: ribbon-helix-helix protein, CopG family [Deltaproteobacteria bacterium]|nr:ribbon-helix-helix protein, CopG family [Deltaproteobacteria bacterium]
MIRTQIQLSKNQLESLKAMAAKLDISLSELIRREIDRAAKTPRSADAGERRKRAMAAAGRFGSGRSDISRRHDDYLGDAYSK